MRVVPGSHPGKRETPFDDLTGGGNSMSELDKIRREMATVLQKPGLHPDPSLRLSRRTFIHKSCLFGAASVAETFSWWPLINTMEVAHAAEAPFKFAWISDTHL
jgi:3',5'-cyclic-AMP phosphodiesterase